MTIHARPGINGNTANDFQAVVDKFTDVLASLADARRALFNDVATGRNYQHLAAPHAVMSADRNTLFNTLLDMHKQLDSIRTDIHNAMQGDR